MADVGNHCRSDAVFSHWVLSFPFGKLGYPKTLKGELPCSKVLQIWSLESLAWFKLPFKSFLACGEVQRAFLSCDFTSPRKH